MDQPGTNVFSRINIYKYDELMTHRRTIEHTIARTYPHMIDSDRWYSDLDVLNCT